MQERIKGFEPTYEELKQAGVAVASDTLMSFEPTYEELKLTPSTVCPVYCFCFEPTYEELKQRTTSTIYFRAVMF